MRKIKSEKQLNENQKLSKKEMSIETLKGFIFTLSLQLLAKIILILLNSAEVENLINVVLKSLVNLFS